MTDDTKQATNGTDDDRPSVLIIDDEERVVQAFELWLGNEYRTIPAVGGEAGLEALDETIDVVLLDRHMPGPSGEEVLDRIRSGPNDPWVVMVTAVDPGFDIIEMPFDEYISKPVDGSELKRIIDQLLATAAYDSRLSELYTVTRKLATLEAEKTNAELTGDDRYIELREREQKIRAETEDLLESSGGLSASELPESLFDSN